MASAAVAIVVLGLVAATHACRGCCMAARCHSRPQPDLGPGPIRPPSAATSCCVLLGNHHVCKSCTPGPVSCQHGNHVTCMADCDCTTLVGTCGKGSSHADNRSPFHEAGVCCRGLTAVPLRWEERLLPALCPRQRLSPQKPMGHHTSLVVGPSRPLLQLHLACSSSCRLALTCIRV